MWTENYCRQCQRRIEKMYRQKKSPETQPSRRNSPNSEMIPTETLISRINSFFEEVGPQQMELLAAGNPDLPTKGPIAELVLNIINTCVQSTLEHFGRTQAQISEEELSAAVADVLPRSFAEATESQISSDLTENLKELLVKEVLENIKSLPPCAKSGPRLTPPERVDSMVTETTKVLQVSTSRSRRRSTDHPLIKRTETGQLLKGLEALRHLRSEQSPVESTDSLDTTINKMVNNIIKKSVDEMMEPFTRTIMSYSSEEMQNHMSEETEKITSHISSVLEAQLSAPSADQKEAPRKGLAGKVKTFFAKQFAKVLMFRTWGRFEKKADKNLKEHSKEATDVLVEAVESLLEVHEGTREGDEEVCCLSIPENKTLYFTQALTDILYEHSADQVIPASMRVIDRRYTDIQHSVIMFLTLVRWWMDTQMEPHTRQVLQALTEGLSSLTPRFTPESVAEPEMDVTQEFVRMTVNRSVCELLEKAKLRYCFTNVCDRYSWLADQVWSHLKNTDIRLVSLKGIHKMVCKDLVHWFGGAENALLMLSLKSPQISSCIATSIKNRLDKKKRPMICRVFRSVGNTLIKPFRKLFNY